MHTLEPAIDFHNRPGFLINWELTFKCNLDCSYCYSHDNTQDHPSFDRCLKSIDFMLEYADVYMQVKKKWQRFAIINIFGGESMFHPDLAKLIKILRERHAEHYADRYRLVLTITTNGVFGKRVLNRVLNLVDEWTVSYHTESNAKQRQQCLDNILHIHKQGIRIHCNLMMHSEQKRWDNCIEVAGILDRAGVHYVPYRLGDGNRMEFKGISIVSQDQLPRSHHAYTQQQIDWFKSHWQRQSRRILEWSEPVKTTDGRFVMRSLGRECCGSKDLCIDGDTKNTTKYITNTSFTDWYCTVNWYFLLVKQENESIYTHKDCKVTFDRSVGPIASLEQADELIDWTRKNIENDSMPMIQCPVQICSCGLCAPKSTDLSRLRSLMIEKHVSRDIWAKY